MKKHKILVVDDEPINIDVLTGLLKADYAMLVAKNGERALKIAHSGKPDLILLDVMMPDMNGYEVCECLKADPETRDIPVVFVTAMGEVDDETRGLEIGAADYIRKPISPPILRARVRTQLSLVDHQKKLESANAIIKSQKERMETELNIGRDIQMAMMPLNFPTAPECGNYSLYATLKPARELGGDFYDFFPIDDSTLCFCVGDVSGKGVPAALFMAVTRTLIRSAAGNLRSTAQILTQVNDVISQDNDNCMFVTLFLALCDTGSGEVTYTSAGHNPPYIVGSDGHLVRLDQRHGPVGGAMEGITYREDKVVLRDGDTLLMYTDGVTEATNAGQELYEEERLVELLQASHDAGPEQMVASVVSAVKDFEGGAEQADDITVLAFRYVGQGPVLTVSENRHWQGLSETSAVIEWFEHFAHSNGIDEKSCRKVCTVLDDLVANVISYGFPDGDTSEIDLMLELVDSQFHITLSDNGIPFNPLEKAGHEAAESIEACPVGGLGIHLVCRIMDEVSYQRVDGRNVLRLSLNL